MLKLIVFDWDDVITIGSKEGYMKCYHDALVEVGVFLDPEEERKRILAKWSTPHREKFQRWLLKEKPELLDRACALYEKKLFGGTFVNELIINVGTVELLHLLHSRYILCVATGMDPRLLKEVVVPKFRIPNVFGQVISTYEIDDPEKHKPHPHILESIMKKQNALPAETVFVGDAKDDVLMARAAHVEPIVVLTGHLNRKEAEELGVKYIISDLTKLECVLSRISPAKIR